MANKTIEDRIAELKKKQEELKEQEKKLKAKAKQEERKARTRRLINIGAEIEAALGSPIEGEDLKKLIVLLQNPIAPMPVSKIETQIGCIAEEVLGRKFTPEDLTRFKTFLVNQNQRGGYFSKAMRDK